MLGNVLVFASLVKFDYTLSDDVLTETLDVHKTENHCFQQVLCFYRNVPDVDRPRQENVSTTQQLKIAVY